MTARRRSSLARRRASLGFTQEMMAAQLGVERSTVQRWERGRRAPQPWLRPKLAATLQVSREELERFLVDARTDPAGQQLVPADLAADLRPNESELVIVGPNRSDLAESDDMQRRALLRLFNMAATALALPAGIPHGPEPARLRMIGIADYSRLNHQLWQVYAVASSKVDVLPLVRRQLSVLAQDMSEPHGADTRQGLCALVGDLLQLAGEIFFDGNAYTDAAHCYALAAQASKDAEAFDLWACAMTRHAYLSVYEHRYGDAVPMLDMATALASRGDSGLSTRYWVAAVQAETYAGLGDFSACERALDDAERVRDLRGQIRNSGWLRFDGSRLAEERGTCYATLGRTDLAENALTNAMKHALTPRRRASVLADLATIGVQRRDRDFVLVNAHAALHEARVTGSGMVDRKLVDLRRRLPPMLSDPQIRQLDAEIAARTVTTRQ
jgi:DNA-binding XRE family transcriptional regulator